MNVQEQHLLTKIAQEFWSDRVHTYKSSGLQLPPALKAGRTTQRIELPAELIARIGDLCNQSPLLKYAFFSACFAILLRKYFNLSIASWGSTRLLLSIEDSSTALTPLLHVLPFEKDAMSFKDLFGIHKEQVLKAYTYQNTTIFGPEAKYSEELLNQLKTVGFLLDGVTADDDTGFFNSTFSIKEDKGNWWLDMNVSTGLLDGALLHFFGRNFIQTLEQVADNPYQPLHLLDLIAPQEKEILKSAFNDNWRERASNDTLVSLFEIQAQGNPTHTAIIFEEQCLNYREVDMLSNQLSAYLLEMSVQHGDLVGIQLERGPWLAISMLAILKSGAAYVPIDPEYPQDRINYIREDSQCRLVLDEVTLANFRENQARFTTARPDVVVAAGDLAYILYTSGSTGRPKGCKLAHAGVVNRIDWMWHELGFQPRERVLQKTTFTFDVSVWEFFLPLCWGNTMVMCTKEDTYSPDRLLALIEKHAINTLHFVPSMFKAFLAELRSRPDHLGLNSLNKVIASGEALLPVEVDTWYGLTGTPLYNLYGPTEASIDVTWYKTQPGDGEIPIGRPIWNTEMYVLDEQRQMLPIGASGEIYIGGIGLSIGYLNRPELTSEKFVDHPFNPGKKLYRTGDLGKWRPDGELIYLGRIDHQVKIRGYRIELGEIENALLGYPLVENTVVIAREGRDSDKQLIAYYVSDQEIQAETLKAYLGEILPAYMLPAFYVHLTEMPQTASGKVDRKLLPELNAAYATRRPAYVAPSNEIEAILVKIWEQVLEIEKVGIHDTFFALGGDSIKAIQVVSKLRSANYTISVGKIILHPVLSRLAYEVRSVSDTVAQSPVQGEVPLNPIQREFLSGDQTAVEHYNQSVLLKSLKRLNDADLNIALDHLVAHHDALRMVFRHSDKGWRQYNRGVNEGKAYHLEFFDYQEAPDGDALLLAQANAMQKGVDLEAGPLLRAGLFRLATSDYLFIAVHHLVIDGVSWRILLEDLVNLLDQVSLGHRPTLPMKTQSYQSWTQHQQEAASSARIQQQDSFWSGIMQAEIAPLRKDWEGGTNRVLDMAEVAVEMYPADTRSLLRVNNIYGTDINDLLLTGLLRALRGMAGQDRFRVYLEGHGRESAGREMDVSRTVGWFTSIYPVLFDLRRDTPAGDTLIEVKETLRNVPDKGIGHGMLKYLSAFEKGDWGEEKEILFNYLGEIGLEAGASRFEFVNEPGFEEINGHRERQAVLELNGMILEGCLNLRLSYSHAQFERSRMETLGVELKRQLQGLIELANEAPSVVRTPSDFTFKGLKLGDVQSLERVHGKLEDVCKLSPLQEGIYFHWLQDPSPFLYFEQLSFRIDGKLDVSQIETAYKTLVRRHSILRTSFTTEYAGMPLQVVSERVESGFQYLDLSEARLDKEKYIAEFRAKDEGRGFDLGIGSQVRLSLLQFSDEEFEFVWSHHHILMDGWGAAAASNELFAIYASYVSGNELHLSTAQPYSAYIQWLETLDQNMSRAYWSEYLLDFSEKTSPLLLPVEPARKGFKKSRQILVIEPEEFDRLKDLASFYDVTTNILFQAAWGVLLGKLNNTQDVVFGAVVSGRPPVMQDIENLLGLFINTIPVRLQYQDTWTWEDVLYSLRDSFVRSENHQYCQLADIQSQANLEGGLFDHILLYQNYPIDDKISREQENLGIKITNVEIAEQTNFDLIVVATPGERLEIVFDYNSNKYSDAGVKRLIDQFSRIFNSLLSDNKAVRIADLINISVTDEDLLPAVNQSRHVLPRRSLIQRPVYIAPSNEIEAILVKTWEEVLGVEKVGIHDNFFALGGHSIKGILVVSKLRLLGYSLSVGNVLEYPVLFDLALNVRPVSDSVDQSPVKGAAELSAMQREFLSGDQTLLQHFNQSVLLKSLKRLNDADLEIALDHLVSHHDALRMVFLHSDKGWRQYNRGVNEGKAYHLEFFDYQETPDGDALLLAQANAMQKEVDLEAGPLLRAGLFRIADGDYLFITAHHLVIDDVSWRILLEDLVALLEQIAAGARLSLPLKTQSYRSWTQHQLEAANSPWMQQQHSFWLETMEAEVAPLRKDWEVGTNRVLDMAEVAIEMDTLETQSLLRVNNIYGTDINDLLLTGFLRALSKMTVQDRFRIYLEGNGRESVRREMDVSRTVGWFTSIYPVLFDLRPNTLAGDTLIDVKETLRNVPDKGIGYGMLEYLSAFEKGDWDEEKEILFNYLGEVGLAVGVSRFELINDPGLEEISGHRERQAVLELNGMIQEGCLNLRLSYSQVQFERSRMETLGVELKRQLQGLIELANEAPSVVRTPSDFTFKGLKLEDVQSLERVHGKLEDVCKLSPLQEGIYFHWLQNPSPLLYFEQFSFRIHGRLDATKIENAYKTLVRRHSILRTSFTNEYAGMPLLVVSEQVEGKYQYLDLSGLGLDKEKYIAEFRARDEKKGFDLGVGSQMRLSLLQLSDEEYELVWSHHHILMDGWGVVLANNELFAIYTSYVSGNEVSLPATRPYSAYIQWLETLDRNITQAYWSDYLSGFSERTSPLLQPVEPTKEGFEKSKQTLVIIPEEFDRLQTLASFYGVTANILFQAIWGVLLAKLNNTQDVVFGAVVSGRPPVMRDVENILGLFINTIPVRLQYKETWTWEDVLHSLRDSFVRSESHQYNQLADIQAQANLEGGLFDHILLYQNFPMEGKIFKEQEDMGIKIVNVEIAQQTNFDLIIVAIPGERLEIVFDYNSNKYSDSHVARLISGFKLLLDNLLERVPGYIEALSIVGSLEKEMLSRFNQTNHPFPENKTLVSLFEEQVEKNPDKIAIIFKGEQSTYREIDEDSNRLARFLHQNLSARPETRVGIFHLRGRNMMVSILGVIKTGAAYVPLDPGLPEERLLFMLKDAEIEILITERKLVEYANRLQWRAPHVKHLICIDSLDISSEKEGLKNELMRKELWEHVGATANTSISQGGWMSSYTGEYMTDSEMQEYAENVYLKLKDFLKPDMRVLEIGCASGLTMFRIAPEVKSYIGTDLSSSILKNTQIEALKKGQNNIQLFCLPAHEINNIGENEFDLIIINSVIHCFDGHNYLRDVLEKAVGLTRDGGMLFLGDLLDEDKRDSLIADMREFKQKNKSADIRTKTDWSSELFLSKSYLDDLAQEGIGWGSVQFSDKIYTIENELTRYRFDATVYVDKSKKPNPGKKCKFQYDQKILSQQLSSALKVKFEPSVPAYIIYTSGSTGLPKGCILEHRGVINRIDWQWQELELYRWETVLQKTTYAFDVSVWEIFLPLCWGARMVIASEDDVANPARLVELIDTWQVNYLHFVPSMFKAFVAYIENESGAAQRLMGLRHVIASGEALPLETVKAWYNLVNIPVHNLYGPTEASIDVTWFKTRFDNKQIPIGKPIWNTEMLILGKNNELLPIGVPGELCIGGVGLAKGYLNRAELTTEKFIPHPFKSGERLYKTGDLGKWLEDGNIVYIGRSDNQVKIRGYRIELGEIENALESHPSVQASAVVVRENSEGEKDLLAYYVSESELDTNDLRGHLGILLPAYMLPHFYLFLTELPLTATGKLDRKKLPDIHDHLLAGIDFVAPENEIEAKMAKIWADVLGVSTVSTTSNFFLNGGDSIKALRLLSKINAAIESDITIGELYSHLTIRNLANIVVYKLVEKRNVQLVFNEMEVLKQEVLANGNDYEGRRIVDVYPMSDIEKGMVFESLFSDASGIYIDQFVFDVSFEDFSERDIHRALQIMIQRHAKLRSGYNISNYSNFITLIYEMVEVPLFIEDLTSLNRGQQHDYISAYMFGKRKEGFPLEKGPLWRLSFFQVAPSQQIMIWEFHHAIMDGWSSASFITELNNIYLSIKVNMKTILEPLNLEYKDFVAGELFGGRNETNLRFWAEELEDYKRLNIFSQEDTDCTAFISDKNELYQDIRRLADKLETSPQIVCLSAYIYALSKYSYSKDITIGLVGNSRPVREDAEKVLGCFLNTLPFRITVQKSERWKDFIYRVHEKVVNLKMHDISLLKIKESIAPNEKTTNPFFDVIFNFVDFHVYKNLNNAGAHISSELNINSFDRTNTYFDLNIDVSENNFDLTLTQTRKLMFDLEPQVFLEKYLCILRSMVADPTAESRQSFTFPEETFSLPSFNATDHAFVEGTLIDLFQNQVVSESETIALIFREERYTYKELDLLSNQLCAFILEQGVISGDLIGVQLGRGPWMLISILAILKSGAAYVPIDPEYPPERITYILKDSKCKYVIDEEALSDFHSSAKTFSADRPAIKIDLDDLAYVLYTSGSTGKPKGCKVRHQGVVNHLDWMWHEFNFKKGERVLQNATFTFDTSVWEFFLPLCWGNTIVMCSKEDTLSPDRLLSLIEEHQVNSLDFVPSMFRAFMLELSNRSEIKSINSLNKVFTGGEALLTSDVADWYNFTDIPLFNTYGPTEASIAVTWYHTRPEDKEIPIGRPIWNTKIFVLDEHYSILPAGAPGEICIDGIGLSTGYLNQPDLTAEKFIEHPFTPEKRLYRTGDMGRWRPDGELLYQGRLDDQIKIRGQRIELGEIENSLLSFPSTKNAAVVVQEKANLGKQLVAYFTADEEIRIEPLKKHMSSMLPEYMIPLLFVQLKEFPKTASGKIDRRSLPKADDLSPLHRPLYTGPTNDLEIALIRIWEDILDVENIGIHDDFFELGGHSLLAMKLASQIKMEFGVKVEVRELYTEATIHQLAKIIDVYRWDSTAPGDIRPDLDQEIYNF